MNSPTPIKVLIVDDQQIIIEGLGALLKGVAEIEIMGGCTDPEKVVEITASLNPDILLMDFNMPGKDGIECIKDVKNAFADKKILMLTGYDDIALIREALRKGASGYVLKNVSKEELIRAIKSIASGQRFLDSNVQEKIIQSFTDVDEILGSPNDTIQSLLSRREQEVLRLIVAGKKSAEIASELFISINTVDTHRKNILAKCDVRNTAQLVAFANKNGLL